MMKPWQTIFFLGIGCFLVIITQYISTIRTVVVENEFQMACEKIKKQFDLQRINIVHFKRPEEYRIIITPKIVMNQQEALQKMEGIGLFFKKNCVPFSTTKIKILHIKEISSGCSSKTIRLEKTLDPKVKEIPVNPKKE